MQKVLLAYSGGLDSAVILHWLSVKKGFNVTAYTAQLGGHTPDFKYQAAANGAAHTIINDLQEKWITNIATTARCMDAIYGHYLLHVALGKVIIAKDMAQYARKAGAISIAHGAHKGENDYHRFKNLFSHLSSDLHVYAPWEDSDFKTQFPNREALLDYAHTHAIQTSSVGDTTLTSEPTVLGVNYENGQLLKMDEPPMHIPDWYFPERVTPTRVTLHFKQGILNQLTTEQGTTTGLVAIIKALGDLAKKFGIGVTDTIETNIDGSKARCVYVQPSTLLWHEAHIELGNMVLTNQELQRRNYISHRSGELIYHGHWFSDEIERLHTESKDYNEKYSGWVSFQLQPGFARIIGRGPAT